MNSLGSLTPLVSDKELIEAEQARRYLRHFLKSSWPWFNPGVPFLGNWHLDAICDHLEAVAASQIRRLVINMPPRMGKSSTVSVAFSAWLWITRPEFKFIFASYAQPLSTRDSVSTRSIILSPWYQRHYGKVFRLTEDTNLKTRFKNDKGGERLATSVSGAITGEGANCIVCLHYSTPIATDYGEIPIGRIVQERLPVKVLGPSGQWQNILEYQRNPAKPVWEIEVEGGGRVRCTEDHPLFIEGRGYVPAKDVIYSSHGDIHLRLLRKTIRQATGSRGAEQDGSVLFPSVLRQARERDQQSLLGWGQGYPDLSCMSWPLHGGPKAGREEDSLFSKMYGNCIDPADQALRRMRGDVPAEDYPDTLLQPEVRQPSASYSDAWGVQRELQARGMGNQVRTRFHQEAAPSGHSTGWGEVRGMFQHRPSRGTPHRRFQDGPCPDQSSNPLSELPPLRTQQAGSESCLDAPARVVAVRCLGTPDAVYNLNVGPDHAYYADGILVHNCDDPNNVKKVESEPIRAETIRWWDEVMSSRLNNPKEDSMIIVSQRTHEDDLCGHVLKTGEYEQLILPMEFEPSILVNGYEMPPTSIGWSDPRVEPGDLLWQERVGKKEVDDMARQMGPFVAPGQLQQRPVGKEGGIIKAMWWQTYTIPLEVPSSAQVIQCWDTAFKEHNQADYSVCATWAKIGRQAFLLDVFRERLGFPALKVKAKELYEQFMPEAVYVENKASGPSLHQELMQDTDIPALLLNPKDDKESRAVAITPYLASGRAWLPNEATWKDEFLTEHSRFPRYTHDDQVDTTVMAIELLFPRGEGGGEDVAVESATVDTVISLLGSQVPEPTYDQLTGGRGTRGRAAQEESMESIFAVLGR